MRTLLPLLIVLACPLMMIFMMRGMGGGAKKRPDHAVEASNGTALPVVDDRLRIAQLEREVAELRGVSLDKNQDRRARRR